MVAKVFLFVILAFATTCEAKKLKFVPTHPYVYNLELKFREDRINDYIVDSFFATNTEGDDKLLNCDITLTDLIKTIPTKKLSLSDFVAAAKELDISFNDDDLKNFISNLSYTELKSIGFSAEKVYKSISKTFFKNRPAELLEFLQLLGIAEEFSVAYTFGTDEDIFTALQNGDYSRENLAKIENLIGAPTTLKELFSALGLKKLNEVALANFINNQVAPGLVQRGLTEEGLKNFLQALGLTVSNYKESKEFKKCYSDLTKDKSIAVAISRNEIITNDDNIVLKYLNLEPYVTLTAKVTQGEGLTYTVFARDIKNDESNNIIHIQIDGSLSSFIDQAKDYVDVSSKSCQYVSLFGDELIVQNIRANIVNERLSALKLFNTPFKKGSPLICEQKLYGLASINKYTDIIFDYLQQVEEDRVPALPPAFNKPEWIDAIKEFFENIHPNFNPCKFFNCGDNKEEDRDASTDGDDEASNTSNENVGSSENNNEEDGTQDGESEESGNNSLEDIDTSGETDGTNQEAASAEASSEGIDVSDHSASSEGNGDSDNSAEENNGPDSPASSEGNEGADSSSGGNEGSDNSVSAGGNGGSDSSASSEGSDGSDDGLSSEGSDGSDSASLPEGNDGSDSSASQGGDDESDDSSGRSDGSNSSAPSEGNDGSDNISSSEGDNAPENGVSSEGNDGSDNASSSEGSDGSDSGSSSQANVGPHNPAPSEGNDGSDSSAPSEGNGGSDNAVSSEGNDGLDNPGASDGNDSGSNSVSSSEGNDASENSGPSEGGVGSDGSSEGNDGSDNSISPEGNDGSDSASAFEGNAGSDNSGSSGGSDGSASSGSSEGSNASNGSS